LIVFGSKEMADEFRKWINFGFSGTRDAQRLGTNAKLSEVQAAVGLAVMDSWGVEEAEWHSVGSLKDEIAENLGLGQFEVIPKGTLSPYWIISHSDHEVLSHIQLEFLENKIETRKWWAEGCHKMPAFSKLESSMSAYSATEYVGKRYLGLPLYRAMNPESLERILLILERLGIGGHRWQSE
jgi:dTDP-4-amino-4,6-dideoxygalactose transaminase